MKKSGVISILFMVLALGMASMAGAASLEHKYFMVGQILEVNGDAAYLCIGSKEGAQVGQELTVYKHVRTPNPNSKSPVPYFKREETGKIKILEIVDEHMATAKIIKGKVQINNTAELNE